MSEQLLKTSGAVFYPLGKKLKNTSGGGGHPFPPPLYVRGLSYTIAVQLCLVDESPHNATTREFDSTFFY